MTDAIFAEYVLGSFDIDILYIRVRSTQVTYIFKSMSGENLEFLMFQKDV